MSLFAATLRVTGLSHKEASDYLSHMLDRTVSEQTVKDMSSGRSNVNQEVWMILRELYRKQIKASEAALDLIDEKDPDEVDYTASSGPLDWPSERVRENVAAMVLLADSSIVV